MKQYKHIKVCHFASVHTIEDTRVFHRECVSMARYYDVTLIGIGNKSGMIQGVNVIGIPKPKSRIHRLLFTTWNAFFKAVRVNALIYHIHDAELLPFGILLSIFGKKVIYDIHENTFEDIRHKPWIPYPVKFITSRLYSFTEWLASWFMHFIIVIAKPELASCFNKRKFSIVQNFADVTSLQNYRVSSRKNLAGNKVFYMGTIHDMYYDFNKIIEATYLLKQRGMAIELVCAGFARNYIANELKEQELYPFIKDHIHFLGHQEPNHAYQLAMDCKMAICLKDQPAPILVSHERKFFEYMALGMPFICCDSHIYTDVLKKYAAGKAVELSNSESIANAIEEMLTDGDFLDKMQAECIRAADAEFNWASQEKILFELYESMI